MTKRPQQSICQLKCARAPMHSSARTVCRIGVGAGATEAVRSRGVEGAAAAGMGVAGAADAATCEAVREAVRGERRTAVAMDGNTAVVLMIYERNTQTTALRRIEIEISNTRAETATFSTAKHRDPIGPMD